MLLCLLIKDLDAQLPGSQEVIADNRWGRIIGLRRKTRALVDYHSFEGVPYALPPLGLLRLANPVPLIGRTLSPYRVFAVKPSCYGIGVFGPVSDLSLPGYLCSQLASPRAKERHGLFSPGGIHIRYSAAFHGRFDDRGLFYCRIRPLLSRTFRLPERH